MVIKDINAFVSLLSWYCMVLLIVQGEMRAQITEIDQPETLQTQTQITDNLCVSISRQNVSVLKESLPTDLVNFKVSFPITSFWDGPVLTLQELYNRVNKINKLPQGILYHN